MCNYILVCFFFVGSLVPFVSCLLAISQSSFGIACWVLAAPSATFISPTAILPNLNWVLTVVGNNIPQDGMNALRIVDPHMTTCEASSASSPAFVIQNVDTNGPQRLLAAILSTAKGIYQVCVCFSGADSFIPVPSGSLSVQGL